jgi:hypothetical protein
MLARLFLALSLLLGAPGAADPAARPAITATIEAQIAAFLADDVETAFGYASDSIRSLFQTPERFGAMVREGYPMVWRPSAWRFLELREVNGNLYQTVLMTGPDGRLHMLEYAMWPGPDGWRIRGVRILRPAEAGA